ncbi:hypothetical protein [Halocatena salina]|uniref:Uncharacterized protein n=1 Tax=Halocatena salina TaxID=2934340 RepID=A0A8U0A798_9EURY|nr:hypothetical protein [Halocatena salina]UPM44716.1 hypothetical protein MW046_16930 [Halocatena salina]
MRRRRPLGFLATAKAGQELFETAVGELQGLTEWLQDQTARSNDRQSDEERER